MAVGRLLPESTHVKKAYSPIVKKKQGLRRRTILLPLCGPIEEKKFMEYVF